MSKTSSKEIINDLLDNLLKTYLESKSKLEQNENSELEVKFGTRGIKEITKNNFDNVIKQLLSNNFKFKEESKYYLRIISNKIRTEIIGLNNIQNYCRTNKLPDEISETIYSFIDKKPYVSSVPEFSSIINYDDYNFRVSYNIETLLSKTSTSVEDLLKTWSTNSKFYRLINRFTMIHEEFPLSIDLSIVRESSKSIDDKNNYILKESNIFNKNPKYEIEIEFDNERIDKIDKDILTSNLLDKLLKKITKYVLSGLQETNYPVSYPEQNLILNNYIQLIRNKSTKSFADSITTKDFIGPSSSTLQMTNITKINDDSKIINIRKNYTVTDKADGDRKMLYISSNGKIYLITTLMTLEFAGAETKNKDLFNSLLDGEHIKHNKSGKFINLYAAFDLYFIGGKDIRSFPFFPEKSDDLQNKFRLPILTNLIKELKPLLVNSKNLSPIRIEKKRFYETNSKQSIFVGCNTIQENINQGLYEYQTDGFIFTPMNLGVGFEKSSDTPKPYKITWKYSLKWKPANFNTIDFLITTKKLQNGSEYIGNIFNSGINTSTVDQIIQYKTIILRVGFDESKHGYINPCANIINDDLPSPDNIDNYDTYKPVQFFPSNPYDPDAGICNIILKPDNTNSKQMFTEENEVIEDNTIVEFRYDITREKNWRWIPLRVRYDKTAEYRSGNKNYGNAYHVAQSNWHSIHNPITLDVITSGENIPQDLADDDIYYNKVEGTSNTKPLRDFHNLYVKNKLINNVSNSGDTLIDYAVGKAGDLPKWISAKLEFIFGIDLSRDNIENRLDGACARYLNYKKKFKILPDALFIQGNASENIKSLQSQFSEKGKQITNAIFGIGKKDEELLGKGVVKSYGKVVDGFNISSIQFAIHYMFENGKTLHNFLTNISECTKLGGYFIGTSFDGKKIFDLLRDTKYNESLTIMDREKKNKLLEITKKYDKDELIDNISCLGYAINVYQESINKVFQEYLVNYDYLISVLENYGFVQLSIEETSKINLKNSVGNFNELFELMNDEIKRNPIKKNDFGTAYKMTSEQRQISFLNKYFIFKKVRNVDVSDIKIGLVKNSPIEEQQRVIDSLNAQEQVKLVNTESKLENPLVSKKKKTKKLKLITNDD